MYHCFKNFLFQTSACLPSTYLRQNKDQFSRNADRKWLHYRLTLSLDQAANTICFFFYFASLYTVQDTEVTVSYAHRKGIWESGGGAPHILHLGTRWGAFPNYPLEPTVLRRYTKCRSHLKILSILHVISIPTVENYKMHDTKITSTGITLTHI